MGNANGREDGENGGGGGGGGEDPLSMRSNGESADLMANNTPPGTPGRSRSPIIFAPQVPVAPLQRTNGPPFLNQAWQNESHEAVDLHSEEEVPTLITWNSGGNDVAVEGSWDNWRSRKMLQRSGKDHSILLVLPSGIYHYKFFVDGEFRYIPDLPFVSDEMGHVCNVLDVHDYVPENLFSSLSFSILCDTKQIFYSSHISISEEKRMAEGGAPPEVTLETSAGSFTVEMYYKHAPRTCRNFIELARRGYYDNVKFHRIIKDFIIQGGDPTGTGRGGESIYGPKFEDEINPKLKHTGAGILSMANAGPNTNGSQFFITLAPAQSLDGKHTIFGRVCRGMEIIKRLGSVQTDNTDRPIHAVKIIRAIVKD